MSRYSYAGDFKNPIADFIAVENPDGEGWIVAVKVTTDEILRDVLHNGLSHDEAELLRERGWRPHTNGKVFAESEDVDEYIEGLEEFFERDYDDYLEENGPELRRMELYEMWRNEY